jgi:predicted RNA-binding protein associated with RNAse of E/G family
MISVRKRDENGQVTWEYTGQILVRGENFVRLEARFNRADMPFQGILLKRDDRFVETFYTDRWYNIFEIHDRDDDTLKGWYCNIGRPAVWDAPDTISYEDLLLDLWVSQDGMQSVLDEPEFERAELDELTRAQALRALAELQNLFKSKQPKTGFGLF